MILLALPLLALLTASGYIATCYLSSHPPPPFISLSRLCTQVPWCNTTECEEDIKTRSGDAAEREGEIDPNALSGKAKTLCIPYDQPEGGAEGKTCIGCGNDATCWVLLGRSY